MGETTQDSNGHSNSTTTPSQSTVWQETMVDFKVFLVTTVLLVVFSLVLVPKSSFVDYFEEYLKGPDQLVFSSRLKPGELAPVYWSSDGKLVDQHARVIGLPPQLSQVSLDYLNSTGILDVFYNLAYEDTIPAMGNRLFTVKDGTHWSAMAPSWTNDESQEGNIHWMDPADEEAYEKSLRILAKGGFDMVLNALGQEFESDSWMVFGMGLIGVSYYKGDNIHTDLPGMGADFMNVIIPLVVPENGGGLHLMDDDDDDRMGTIPFAPNVGICVGGDTKHGTGHVDYRSTKELRVGLALYIADVDEENAQEVASDVTSIFPVYDDGEWVMAQQGRAWTADGNSLKNDKGRRPYTPQDDDEENCPQWAAEGKCETDLDPVDGARVQCQKSCKLYIDDERYFTEYFPSSKQ